MGICPAARIAARLDLVARRSDGNREFARLLELCLTHSVEAVEVALRQAREQGGWSADTVRHLLNFASVQEAAPPPLDPSKSPAYQAMTPPPDLTLYNRRLQVQL
jgi:hypothetical protein